MTAIQEDLMNDLYSFVKKLRLVSSRSEKEKMLREFPAQHELKLLLQHTYEPLWNYYIREFEMPDIATSFVSDPTKPHAYLYDLFKLLFEFKERVVTGNAAKEACKSFVHKWGTEPGALLSLILKRDLDCGVAAKTVNKVWPGLVTSFEIQLALPVEKEEELVFPAYIQEKFDGVRIIAIVESHQVRFFTRKGEEARFPELEKQILSMGRHIFGKVLDGEIIGENRQKVSGLVNKYLKGTAPEGTDKGFHFHVFDLLTFEEFQEKLCKLNTEDRLVRMECLISETENIHKVESTWTDEPAAIYQEAQEIMARGGEGVIVKPLIGEYNFKRSKDWLKVKGIFECELVVTGTVDGKGKREGMVGSIIGETRDGKVKVKVGGGFTDDDIAEMTENRDRLKGRIFTVRYNMVVQSEDKDTFSLFLPRFVIWRFDKEQADAFSEVELGTKDVSHE